LSNSSSTTTTGWDGVRELVAVVSIKLGSLVGVGLVLVGRLCWGVLVLATGGKYGDWFGGAVGWLCVRAMVPATGCRASGRAIGGSEVFIIDGPASA
jgi:hypothetical protein